eukprot:2089854-Rhodomonas_salina.1
MPPRTAELHSPPAAPLPPRRLTCCHSPPAVHCSCPQPALPILSLAKRRLRVRSLSLAEG